MSLDIVGKIDPGLSQLYFHKEDSDYSVGLHPGGNGKWWFRLLAKGVAGIYSQKLLENKGHSEILSKFFHPFDEMNWDLESCRGVAEDMHNYRGQLLEYIPSSEYHFWDIYDQLRVMLLNVTSIEWQG